MWHFFREKEEPKDYSRSQVAYESTGSGCCKSNMYHSQMHKKGESYTLGNSLSPLAAVRLQLEAHVIGALQFRMNRD